MTVYKRGNTFTYHISATVNGKRVQKTKGGFKTEREAKRAGAKAEVELRESGGRPAPTKLTVGELLEKWLKVRKSSLSPNTYHQYRSRINRHLAPAFGETRLADLTRLQIVEWAAESLESGRAVASVRQHLTILATALNWAVEMQMIPHHPAGRIKVGKLPAADATGHPLPEEGQKRLLALARPTRLYAPILVALATGMRVGEVLGLRWQDVDLQTGVLRVRQALRRGLEEMELAPPKTEQSRRDLTLPPVVCAVLQAHRERQEEEKAALGAWPYPELIFPNRYGGLWRADSFSREWRRLRDAAGLTVRFHDLRHTAASILLREGVNIKAISRRLGHSSVGITLGRYSHLMPGEDGGAAEAAGRSLGRVLGEGGNGVPEGIR